MYSFGGKFDADGGFGILVEFIFGEAEDEVGFPNAGIAEENDFEDEVVGFGVHGDLMIWVREGELFDIISSGQGGRGLR